MIDDLATAARPAAAHALLRRRGVCRLDDGRWVVAGAAAVTTLLCSPDAVVPTPAHDDVVRGAMARFSEGDAHRRRRAVAVEALARLDPAALRRRSRERTLAIVAGATGSLDVMAAVAREVPVAVLAEALGAGDVAAACDATRRLRLALAPPRGQRPAPARPALDDLVALLPEASVGPAERGVNLAALLFQASDATAGLIGNALLARRSGATADQTIAAVLRDDPPVQHTVRHIRRPLALDGKHLEPDDVVVAVLAAAAAGDPELAFGAGRHRCPGSAHAVAIAAGVLDGLADVAVRPADGYEPRANLRIPGRLLTVDPGPAER